MAFQLAEPLNPSETGLVLLLGELLRLLLLLQHCLLLELILLGHLLIDGHLIEVDTGTA